MLQHNLKLVLRYLWNKKIYTSVILLSLTVGFVCANLLISFLVSETNADSFHKKQDRIFQLSSNDPFAGEGQIVYVPDYFQHYITTNYNEVERMSQVANHDGLILKSEQNELTDLIVVSTDSAFFSIFDFPVNQRRGGNYLNQGDIVLSNEKAVALFGKSNVLGEVVSITSSDTTVQLSVSAILDRPVDISHLQFDAIIHHSVFADQTNGGASYVLLNNMAKAESLLSKINSDDQRPGLLGAGEMTYFLSPLTDSYFNAKNKMSFMKTRSPLFIKVGYIVCGLILFIAGFNFINLFLLSWQSRRKDVGIKKTLGVTPTGLINYSIVEAGVYISIAYGLSLLITTLLIPLFNSIFEASITSMHFFNVKVITILVIILFSVGVFVSVLSMLKQWRMKPINLISKNTSRATFSRMLFTIQFVISITLAVCAVTIIKQMHHIENAPLGFNRSIIQLSTPDKDVAQKFGVLKQKIGSLAGVNSTTVCSGNPISGNMMARYELKNGEFYTPYIFAGDKDFLTTLNLKLIEGQIPSEVKHGKLVNQKLVHQFNLKDPVGKRIPGTEDVIAGVVGDFTCSSFKEEIPPVIISYTNEAQALLIDYKGNNLSDLLPALQAQWKNVFPDQVFQYRIIQDDLMKKYKEDTFFYRIIVAFSVISMVLSCFGLFALSWAVIQHRTKEIGIRKVLGANSLDILNILTITFTKRIALAFLLSAPLGYYLMSQWLARFANRIELSIWIFLLAAVMVFLIALITLGIQTVKAALTNPVDEIRSE